MTGERMKMAGQSMERRFDMLAETALGTSLYLGPAIVDRIAGERLRLRLPSHVAPSGVAWARLALAFPYEPAVGDSILAIGAEEIYVVGVLGGRGKTAIRVPGDLRLSASGRVSIEGGEGIDLRSPEITLKADRLETIARTIFERCLDCYRKVKGAIQTSAARMRTVVEDGCVLRAGSISETAEKDVRIDGRRIHLG